MVDLKRTKFISAFIFHFWSGTTHSHVHPIQKTLCGTGLIVDIKLTRFVSALPTEVLLSRDISLNQIEWVYCHIKNLQSGVGVCGVRVNSGTPVIILTHLPMILGSQGVICTILVSE